MTERDDLELLAKLIHATHSQNISEVRAMVRSIYGALCIEAGLDKQAALAELASHWDHYEAVVQRAMAARLN